MKHPFCTPSQQIIVTETKVDRSSLQKHTISAFFFFFTESLLYQKKDVFNRSFVSIIF